MQPLSTQPQISDFESDKVECPDIPVTNFSEKISMNQFMHDMPRCQVCRAIGFLPRNPFPLKKTKKKVSRKSRHQNDSLYDLVSTLK